MLLLKMLLSSTPELSFEMGIGGDGKTWMRQQEALEFVETRTNMRPQLLQFGVLRV